jgi:hypothetical protein
MLLTSI